MNPYIPIYIFAAFLTGSFVLEYTPAILSLLYIIMGILTFGLYWKDKSAAVSGRWRIKESTLHIFALLFGWMGAIIAQQSLRHKTQKQNFRLIFWATVVLNIAFTGWLHTSSGQHVLNTLIPSLIQFFSKSY